LYIKDGVKEELDYKILDQQTYSKLSARYGA